MGSSNKMKMEGLFLLKKSQKNQKAPMRWLDCIYDSKVVQFTKQLKPSQEKELKFMDLNQLYLEKGMLRVSNMGRGYAWLDTGTHQDLHDAEVLSDPFRNVRGFKSPVLKKLLLKQDGLIQNYF